MWEEMINTMAQVQSKEKNRTNLNGKFVSNNLRKVYMFARKKIKYIFESFLVFLFARHYAHQSTNWNQMRITETKYDPYVREILFGSILRWKRQENIFRQLITSEHPVLFDIGANIGFVSLLLSKIQGSTVYSFEPVSRSFACLQKNISQNNLSHVLPFHFGFSNKEQKLFIGPPAKEQHVRYGRKDKKTGLFSVHATQKGKNAEAFGEIAVFTTIDLFCEKNKIQTLDYLKIDVEGHELNVLQGGICSLIKFQPICQVEIHPITMQIANRKPKEIIDFFKKIGYVFFVFENEHFVRIDLNRFVQEYNMRPVELYCFPKSKHPPESL